jgi:hypothetical protein
MVGRRFLMVAAARLVVASAALAHTGQLGVRNAWARATPAKAENGVALLTIRTPSPDRLVSVSSPVAKRAELHTLEMAGMLMKMRRLAALEIPAGQPVTWKPGGKHITRARYAGGA